MGEILFLAHRIPFPPDRGDKIRSHHILKALAAMAPVHVATFTDDDDDHRYEAELAGLAASYCLVNRRKPLPLAGIEAMATGKPLSLAAFHDRRLQRYISDLLSSRDIAAIYVFSGQMAQYVPAAFRGRVIADLVDVDSAKFEAYAAKGSGFRAWMESREARLLSIEEERIARASHVTLLISNAEAALLRSRLTVSSGQAVQIAAMGNGMDSGHFDPACVVPEPRMRAASAPRLIFTGQMDYAPNVEGVIRAIDRIMPRVRTACPGATLHVVGRNPSAELKARGGRDGIAVWGRVDDIRPWLAGADIALVPLEIARGVQNKVLEAMAMRLPVVLSPEAATGIGARDGRDFTIAESDEALAGGIVQLANDKARSAAMGDAARRWIEENASWPAALAELPQHLGIPAARMSDAA